MHGPASARETVACPTTRHTNILTQTCDGDSISASPHSYGFAMGDVCRQEAVGYDHVI